MAVSCSAQQLTGGRMGKKDIALKDYLSDRRRYADLINGTVFCGEEIVRPDALMEANAVQSVLHNGHTLERTNDLIMRQDRDGKLFAVWIVANQEHIDYSMPARVMLQEALEYDRQLKEIKRETLKPALRGSAEFLCGIRMEERLRPVVTVVVYWGSETWRGAESMHDLIDFGEDAKLAERLRMLVPIYPLHILRLSEQKDYEWFRTELGMLFALYARRNDRDSFKEYLDTHKACRNMDDETCQTLGMLTGSARLLDLVHQAKDNKKGEINVCRAIDELIEEGVQRGIREGIAEAVTAMAVGMRKLAIPQSQICQMIADELHIPLEQAEKFLQ